MSELLETNLRLLISALCLTYSIILIQNSTRFSPMRHFGFSEGALGLWYLFSGLQIQISDVEIVILLRSLVYVFSEFACASVFLYCFLSTSLVAENHYKFINFIYLVPIISIIITLLSFIFFRVNPYIVNLDSCYLDTLSLPFKDYMLKKRGLYFAHCFFCYLLLSLTIGIFTRNIIKHPKENKRITMLTTIGIIVFFIPNFYRLYTENFSHQNIENLSSFFELFAFLFMSSISFAAVYFDKNEMNANICKTSFYEFSGLPVFIFTADMKFLQVNSIGKKFLDDYEIKVKKFDSFETIFPNAKLKIFGIPDSPASDSEFYISSEKDKKLYYAQKQETKDRNNQLYGYFIFLSKIDFYSEIIKNLEQKSYTDEITGCKRSSIFIQHLTGELQKKSDMHLVCAASIENLEMLNKKIGIIKTDSYIKDFAEILRNSLCRSAENIQYPEKIEVFRLNGSLFAFVLPSQFENEIPQLFKSIRTECYKFSKSRPEVLTCSLGYSVTDNVFCNVESIMHKCYGNMLLDRQSHQKNSRSSKDN